MELSKIKTKNKRGFTTVNAIIAGIGGLAFGIVLMFILLTQLSDDTLTGSGTAADTAVDDLIVNVSSGVTNVSNQIPTVFNVGAIVLVIGILAILWVVGKRSGFLGNSNLS